ncbi:hypothetical protein M011DRAFT_114758 [Sporormia fimetaria CBS 119925]|uniref:Sister chromatid cohesion and DNA repair protein n=1 Tax=Sporormia fimetaria CBS 119925 TaxID=1340428 RepID=A0A6A6VLG1_9PLEO|nr:hypothetical protein M011DRAFT_114758 [Sporormia fimetaria CBS 119925]
MASRSRRSAATEVVEEEEEEQGTVRKLRFKQSLVGRPGKPIGVGDLLARLKALCEELRSLEQEEADRESLEPVAKDLAQHSLLQHKDVGVRAWTACCLVDMFRLCAPDAPYTAAQLKEIFTLIIVKIFPLLADPSNPYNAQHLYVLKCLAEVKSIVLLTDIPSTAQLTTNLFRTCFDVLSGPSKAANGEELSKNVEHHMTALLFLLIDEAPSLSSDIVDIIVAQFLWADPISLGSTKGKKNAPVDAKQSTLLRKEAPPAYNMAKNICNACSDKMARSVGIYFSSVIVDFAELGPLSKRSRHRASSAAADSEDDMAKGPSEDDINDANKAHRLLRELWRCAPSVLQDIIPHLQEELGTENVVLRQMATETFGDMIAGIGAAGPPPLPDMNPAAYPSQSLSFPEPRPYNFLTTPTSPNSFSAQYPGAYHSFLQRKNDKSPVIRAAWATGVGRILMTSAGGVGLESDEEQNLLESFAETLIDSDERVRLAAIRAVGHFEFRDIVDKLGRNGGMSEPGSILSNLADRVKDKRSIIHSESMKLLSKIWGVAEGAIADGDERITRLLGAIPSRILETCYVNDLEINVQVDLALYDALLPLGYPPMKPKAATNGNSQVVKDSQTQSSDRAYTEADLDKIRARRQLVLVHSLDERAKKVFFAKQSNQAKGAVFMEHFLKVCEDYNGGVMGKGAKEIKAKLEGLIHYYAKTLPDSSRVVADLWKFADAHDRRNYQLIRFCMAPESEYRKVFRSIKELRKRLEDGQGTSSLLETLTPLVYRVSLLCYNKSHLPAIIEYSRIDDDGGLGSTAHEVLKEISTHHPKVFSSHVKELCKALETDAPTSNAPNSPGAVQDLKACAGFVKKFPAGLPINAKEGRMLSHSLVNYALYGSPPEAAKYAVTIIMNSDNKKEIRAKEILVKSIKNFEYGCSHFLTKLAAISQIVLLAPDECEDDNDEIIGLAVSHVLLKPHAASSEADSEWMNTPDEDMVARKWALRILVNRLRSYPEKEDIEGVARPIYTMLNKLVKEFGESSKKRNTPLAHRNLQRLVASQFLLKLSCTSRLDGLLAPTDFNELALVTHDPHAEVRTGFVTRLLKYLGQNRLPRRFYTILFMCAHEPTTALRERVATWIRARRAFFESRKEVVFEPIFARLLSVLAHHPDFDTDDDEWPQIMSKYILFYLKCVATSDNLPLIYQMAQRVKGVADGITSSEDADQKLYILSDLAQSLIRYWEEQNGWSMQAYPGKLKLPAAIFRPLESHDRAQEIADNIWISEEVVEQLEPLVRSALRTKKRRATDLVERPRKKTRADKGAKKEKVKVERPMKTPKARKKKTDDSDVEEGADKSSPAPESRGPRRKSGRQSMAKSYVEVSSDEEEDAEGGAQEDEQMDDDDKEPASEGDNDVAMAEAEDEVEKEAEVNGDDPEQAIQSEQEEVADEDAELEPEEEQEEQEAASEAESEPSPAKRPSPKQTGKTIRGRGAKKPDPAPASDSPSSSRKTRTSTTSNKASSTGTSKTLTPAKPTKAKAKAKANASPKDAPSSGLRRSGRSRA